MSDPGGTFISYAQHGEDVILWRALGHRAHVRYVDVGAFHPTDDSITRALYERGWRGVNIEALPERAEAFAEARPEDINLAVAVGDHDGTARLTLPETPGWETICEPEAVSAQRDASRQIEVPLRTLATLLPELGLKRLDVLKIDVEGAEPAVVRGLLDSDVRPIVCVVEGTSPSFGRAAGDEAVRLLLDAGYMHTMFDGLNHYLTTDPALADALSIPASPTDQYVQFRMVQLTEQNMRLREAVRSAEVDGRSGIARIDPWRIEQSTPEEAVEAVYRAVLGRAADAPGLAAWSEHVAGGASWLTVAERLADSEEARRRPEAEQGDMERALLAGRLAQSLMEIGPKVKRRGPYNRGVVAREMFVEALFEATLGREPDDAERAEQVARMAGGAGREQMEREFTARPGATERLLGTGPQGRVARLGERLSGRDPLPIARARVRAGEARRIAGLALAYLDAVSGGGS